MTHGREMFEIQPHEDGEALLDFGTGTYVILQPVVGRGGKSRSRRAPTGADRRQGEGPYRYHMTRCQAAAQVFGWRAG